MDRWVRSMILRPGSFLNAFYIRNKFNEYTGPVFLSCPEGIVPVFHVPVSLISKALFASAPSFLYG